MNYYEHHMGDYLKATAHLSALEDCFYRRALDWYYSNEKALPEEVSQVARLLRAQGAQERKAVASVLSEFFTLSADGWHNKRADAEIIDLHIRQETNRENGRKGGRPKKEPNNNPEVSGGFQVANPDESETKGLQTPDSSLQTPDQKHRAPRSPSGSRLPTDWSIPDDWIPVAESIGVPVGAVLVEASKFRDHWLAKSGKDGRKADWLACWRTWCRNAVDWTYQPKNGGQRGTNQPVRLTAVDRAIADNEQHRLRREGTTGRTIDG